MAKPRKPRRTKPVKRKPVKRKSVKRKPVKRKPVRRPAQPKPVKRPRREDSYRETLRLIREQEAALAAAEREEEAALARLIQEQEGARREWEREAEQTQRELRRLEQQRQRERVRRRERREQLKARRAREEQRRVESLGRWFEREAAKDERREQRERLRQARAAAREHAREEQARLKEWEEQAERGRRERGVTPAERRKLKRQERLAREQLGRGEKTVQEYILECLTGAHDCLKGLGFRVGDLQPWTLPDGSFDAQLVVFDPDDTTGAEALLRLSECIRPVVGAYIAIKTRHYPSGQTDRRIEQALIGGKKIPQSLGLMEDGLITNMTNYRLAEASNIADHFNAWEVFLRAFAEKNQAYCAQIIVLYHYSPKGGVPR